MKARDRIQECEQQIEGLDPVDRDDLQLDIDEVQEEIEAAESRIKAAEATEAARKDEHAKAGNVMALYRQMMQGGGAGGAEKDEAGDSGSGEGSGSPNISTGSIAEEFEFDSIGSASGSLSGGAWGRAPDDDAGDDDDDGW